MNITFINRTISTIIPLGENIYFYCSYIIAETSSYQAVFSLMEDHRELALDQNNEEFILELFIVFYKNSIDEKQYRKDFNNLLDWCKKHKNAKHKTKEMMLNFQRRNLMLRQMLNHIIEFNQKVLHDFGFAKDQMELLDQKIAFTIEDSYDSGDYYGDFTEDTLSFIIPNNIIKLQNYLLLEDSLDKILNKKVLDETEVNEINDDDFICIPLFQIPYFRYFNANSLVSIRLNLRNNMNSLSTIIDELQANINNLDFDKSIIGTLISFQQKLNPLLNSIKEQIESQVYLKKEINSGSLSLNMQICIGICKTNSIPKYYESIGIITTDITESILKKIDINNKLNKSLVFIYIIPEGQNIYDFLISYKNSLQC